MCLSAFKQIADTIRAGPVAAAAPAVDDTVEEAVPALPLRSKPVNVIATETGLLYVRPRQFCLFFARMLSSPHRDSAAFEGVPPSIRGRCKFDDVVKVHNELTRSLQVVFKCGPSQTYAVIKSYYADEPSTTKSRSVKKAWSIPKAILTVGASEKLGAKVSGLSGKCVLNTLRHLGFITVCPGAALTFVGVRQIPNDLLRVTDFKRGHLPSYSKQETESVSSVSVSFRNQIQSASLSFFGKYTCVKY